ncbi:MAG: site-2 protease family protein [Parcubacteria group bacterium]|jgi:Zn-dependent protease
MLNDIILIIFFYAIFAYSVIIHEVAHGYMALLLGDPTAKYAGRLTANPLKHIDPFLTVILPLVMIFTLGIAFGGAKPVPYNPYNLRNQKWGPTWVALAGPASNIIIVIFFTILAKLVSLPTALKVDIINNLRQADWSALATVVQGSPATILFTICTMAIFWNVLIAIFNLIPFPPLDGSKLLFALLPIKMEIVAILEQYGFILLFVFVFLFVGPLSLLLNFFWQLFFTLSL